MTSNATPISSKASVLIVEDNADQWYIVERAMRQRFPEAEPIWMQEADQVIMYLETCVKNSSTLQKLILLDLYLPHRRQG